MGILNWMSSKSSDVMEFKDFERQVTQAMHSASTEELTRLLTNKVRCPRCSKIAQPAIGFMGPQRDRVIVCSLCTKLWLAIFEV